MRAIVMSLVVAMSLMVFALPYEAAADCGDRTDMSSTPDGDAVAATGVSLMSSLNDGAQQRFIVQVGGSTQTLLIDNNVDIGKRVPVATGDDLTIHGEYVWNDQGGLIHFTHHDPAHTHEDGWIELKGVRYS